jgi:hypothetical protein
MPSEILRGSSVGIAMDWTIRVQFPEGTDFSLLHYIQTSSGANSASYTMGTGLSLVIKWLVQDADH